MRWALTMMADELNIDKGRFVKTFMKICGRGRPAQSSSIEETWTSKSDGDLNKLYPDLSR
jgi:hypothetical protein